MLPTIYTPVVGDVVENFSEKYVQARGIYIACENSDRIEELLNNRSNPEVRLIVVSDGEGVLGIGDQGVGAMSIPVAKLMVYTAFGGVDPLHTLPIMLDAGTNNKKLLDDPFYLGCRHPRISGKEYDEFIEKFIAAVKKVFPHVYLHWEDFGRYNAYQNLAKYREKICSFNDDIQGTGVVTLAAVLAAIDRTKVPLAEQRIVMFGAGTAGMGVTDNIHNALVREGLSESDARKCFWLLDRPGLLTETTKEVTEPQRPYLRSSDEIASWKVKDPNTISLLEVVQNVKPTILIGCSAQSSAFNEAVVKEMAKYVKQPVIFPLSNPTEKSEAIPVDLLTWTNGKALIATGSPFDPVTLNGKKFIVSQCNNYLTFPGIGLGVISVKATRVSDNMLWAASKALSQFSKHDLYTLLPIVKEVADATHKIAIAVGQAAIEEGLSPEKDPKKVPQLVADHHWEPEYLPYRKV